MPTPSDTLIAIYDFESALEAAAKDVLVALLGEESAVNIHTSRSATDLKTPFITLVAEMGTTGGERESYHRMTDGGLWWDIIEGKLQVGVATRRRENNADHRIARSVIRLGFRHPHTLNEHLAYHQCLRLAHESSPQEQIQDGKVDASAITYDVKMRVKPSAWPDIQGQPLLTGDHKRILTGDGKPIIIGL